MLLDKAIKKSPNFFNKMEDEDSINIYDSDSFLDLLDSDDYESNPTSKQQLQQKSQTPSAVTADSEGKIGEFRHGIVSKLLEKFEIIFTAGTFYLYDDEYGYYIEHDEDSLNARIEEEFEDPAKNSIFLTKEATAELKRNTLVKKGFEFNPSREYINFEDFVYNIKTGEILNHSPDFALNYVVPAKIRSKSSYMPNFLKFVDTLCEGDESKIARLQEFLGVLLSPLQPKNAFFFIGVHDCGKTTLSNFVEELIGEDFVSSVPLDAFDKDFEFSQIFEKRLNVCDELCDEYNSRIWSIFKRLTGKGKVSINRKYQKPLSCHPNVKLLITGNKLPIIPDDSSLPERIQVIFFNYSVPKSERDSSLPQKLWAERDAIVHWALDGLSRYLKKGEKFTSTTDNDVIKSKYITADSLTFFIETYLQYEDEAKTTTNAIFNAYNGFCGENRIPFGKRKSRKALKATIRNYFPDAVETKIGTLQGFKNIKLLTKENVYENA